MTTEIHPTAVVEGRAMLADEVVIGPLCHVGAGVEIGQGSELMSHVTIFGPTRLGRGNRVFPYTTLGSTPQDRSFAGEPTRLEIGDDNIFREQVTVHRGTLKGGGVTRIGSRCLFMVGAHVAHDCSVADDVILTNLATLGGHVVVGRGVVCGGHVAVAPFVRLGRACFVAGGAKVERDVPPFVISAGDRARVRALNELGLRRADVPEKSCQALDFAFRMIWRSNGPMQHGIEAARAEFSDDPYVAELLDFLGSREL